MNSALTDVAPGNRMVMTASRAGVEALLDQLTVEVDYLGYDLERWTATPVWEQDHPVEAVQQMQEIAHARGMKLLIGPSKGFNETYGSQLALYTDVYGPQAKPYQAWLTPEEYRTTVRALMTTLRTANPKVKLFLDVSPTPKDVTKTPQEMLDCVNMVKDLVDGVWVTASNAEGPIVADFAKLLRS